GQEAEGRSIDCCNGHRIWYILVLSSLYPSWEATPSSHCVQTQHQLAVLQCSTGVRCQPCPRAKGNIMAGMSFSLRGCQWAGREVLGLLPCCCARTCVSALLWMEALSRERERKASR